MEFRREKNEKVRDNALFHVIQGHTAEVLSLCFNTVGNQLITGSFDHTIAIWDVASGRLGTGIVLHCVC